MCFFCHQMIQFSVFMTSLAREAVEKICQLFHNSSTLMQLAVCHFTFLVYLCFFYSQNISYFQCYNSSNICYC